MFNLQDGTEIKINGVSVCVNRELNPFVYTNTYLDFISEYNIHPEIVIPLKNTNKTYGKLRCWQDKSTKEYLWTVYGDRVGVEL